MTHERTIVSGLAALVTCAAAALLPACHQPWQVGAAGIVATLGLIAFTIALGDD